VDVLQSVLVRHATRFRHDRPNQKELVRSFRCDSSGHDRVAQGMGQPAASSLYEPSPLLPMVFQH